MLFVALGHTAYSCCVVHGNSNQRIDGEFVDFIEMVVVMVVMVVVMVVMVVVVMMVVVVVMVVVVMMMVVKSDPREWIASLGESALFFLFKCTEQQLSKRPTQYHTHTHTHTHTQNCSATKQGSER
jgi:hypothetical protein